MRLPGISVGLKTCFDLVAVEEKTGTISPTSAVTFSSAAKCSSSGDISLGTFSVSGFGGPGAAGGPIVNVIVPVGDCTSYPNLLTEDIGQIVGSLAASIVTSKTGSRKTLLPINASAENEKTFNAWAAKNGVGPKGQSEIISRRLYEFSNSTTRIQKQKLEYKEKEEQILFAYDSMETPDIKSDRPSFIPGFSIEIGLSANAKDFGASFEDKAYMSRLVRLLDVLVGFPPLILGPKKGLGIRRKYGFLCGLFRVLTSTRMEYLGATPAWLRAVSTTDLMLSNTILAVKLACLPDATAAMLSDINDDLIQKACNCLDPTAKSILHSIMVRNLLALFGTVSYPRSFLSEESLFPWVFLNDNKDVATKMVAACLPARAKKDNQHKSLHEMILGGDLEKDIISKYSKFLKTV